MALAQVAYGTRGDSAGGINLLASVKGETFFTTTTEKITGNTKSGGQHHDQYSTTIYATDGSTAGTQTLLNISVGASDTVTGSPISARRVAMFIFPPRPKRSRLAGPQPIYTAAAIATTLAR